VAARFEALSNAGIVGSNHTQGMDVCVRLFCVCIVMSVGSGLATGWSPVQGVLPTVYRIKKLKKRPRSNKRTVEPQIDGRTDGRTNRQTDRSMALKPFLWPWPLSVSWSFTQSVRLLGRRISPSHGRYLHTEQTHTDNHASSGIRTHDPSVWAGTDGLCLIPRWHCDRQISYVTPHNCSTSNDFTHTVSWNRMVIPRRNKRAVSIFALSRAVGEHTVLETRQHVWITK
jgi:hypothetical protein